MNDICFLKSHIKTKYPYICIYISNDASSFKINNSWLLGIMHFNLAKEKYEVFYHLKVTVDNQDGS